MENKGTSKNNIFNYNNIYKNSYIVKILLRIKNILMIIILYYSIYKNIN